MNMNDEPVIDIRHLSVRFGDFTAVDDVSFSVSAGEIFGFLGANGSGKTTTIRVLCGLLVPASGSARVGGADIYCAVNDIKRQVGYMSQRFTLYDDLTVGENLAFKAALRGMDDDALRLRQEQLFSLIRFNYPPGVMVRNLPAGIKQQVSLCAALLHEPRIVFLDEPTAGVAPAERAVFWDLIRALAAQGTTIIVTTHYMDEAEQCGRIALMRDGKLLALDTPAALKRATYPEPIIEISGVSPAGIAAVRQLPGVRDCWPFGLKYHLSAVPGGHAALLGRLSGLVAARNIQPTLEDVFIRIVEGAVP